MTNKLEKVARRVALAAVIVAGAWVVRRAVRKRRRTAAPQRALSRRPAGPVTQSLVSVNPADTPMGEPGQNQEQRLDEALKETFPASDPISTGIE